VHSKATIAKAGAENLGLQDLAEIIKHTAFRVTRCGELIGASGRQNNGDSIWGRRSFLAPTLRLAIALVEILQILGVDVIGAPGSTAILAMLNDAGKKRRCFCQSKCRGTQWRLYPDLRRSSTGRSRKKR